MAKIVIIGRAMCGKSTLARMLLREGGLLLDEPAIGSRERLSVPAADSWVICTQLAEHVGPAVFAAADLVFVYKDGGWRCMVIAHEPLDL